LSVVSTYLHRRRLRIDLLSRTSAVYLVYRRLAAAVLSFSYPWFDFPAIIFTLFRMLTDLRSAGQPTEKAVSRPVLFSIIQVLICLRACACSLSSFLRNNNRAIPGPRSPWELEQACMYALYKILCQFTYTHIKSTVALRDGNGQQVYSAPATVQDGGDSRYVSICAILGPLS